MPGTTSAGGWVGNKGTHLEVRFSRVVDGDTIRVFLPSADKDESLRILTLDTEESNAGSSKPVTPWGKKAKEKAEAFFQGAEQVVIEFPGNEEPAVCIEKYRGNFGRLLVYVYRNGVDYQELMIREGYSPYFMKYGHAVFSGHHQRYRKAERESQHRHLGDWDQIGINGPEQRNYAALGTWWQLRADIIDVYRRLRAVDPTILNSRLDYTLLESMARNRQQATVFTELSTLTRVGGSSGLIGIGSIARPFNLFLPDIDSPEGQEVVNLLESRYISAGETHPRRSYAYVTDTLSTFRERPQMFLPSVAQISDAILDRLDADPSSTVVIASLLPDPVGADAGLERVELRNTGATAADLQGSLATGQSLPLQLPAGRLPLNNGGDEVGLFDRSDKLLNQVSYAAADVAAGEAIEFI